MQNLFRFLLLAITIASGGVVNAQQNEMRALANGLATDIAAAGKKSIAVVDFTDLQGNPTELGRFLAEEFSVALMRTHKGFEVIERSHLKAVLTEHKLASTGLIDPATAKKLGQFVGADALLTGSMTPFSESVRIAVKVITTDTARIIAADTADLPKTKTINELIGGPSAARHDDDNERPRLSRSTNHSSSDQPNRTDEVPTNVTSRNPTVSVMEFVYELLSCRGVGASVRCSFRITNRGKDRSLGHYCTDNATDLSFPTRAFDNLGNQGPGGSCSLANGTSGYDGVGAMLVDGITVPASIVFRNLNASASTLALINIKGRWSDRSTGATDYLEVSFRNVPIVR